MHSVWVLPGTKNYCGQVGLSLIKSMCSMEAPLCDAVKHIYRSLLPTFFSPTFHLYDKMPAPCSVNNSLLTDSSRIMTVGKRVRWAGTGGDNWAPQSHHDSCRLHSILSLTLSGRPTCAKACMLMSCRKDEGGRTVGQDHIALVLGRKATWSLAVADQAPLTSPTQ